MKEKLIELVEKEYLRNDIPQFKAGDTIGVYYKVKEGNKERVQEDYLLRKQESKK